MALAGQLEQRADYDKIKFLNDFRVGFHIGFAGGVGGVRNIAGFAQLTEAEIIGGRKGGVPEMTLEYVLKTNGLDIGVDDSPTVIFCSSAVSFCGSAAPQPLNRNSAAHKSAAIHFFCFKVITS